MGQPDEQIVLVSSAGFGFVTQLDNLYSKNKAGKASITLPAGSEVLEPCKIKQDQWLIVVTSEPRMLVFPVSEMPVLSKGKGNKLIQLPKGESVCAVFAFTPGEKLVLKTVKYEKIFGPTALEEAFSARAKKGLPLPRTLKSVLSIRVAD